VSMLTWLAGARRLSALAVSSVFRSARLRAVFRGMDSVPRFGPVVAMVRVTLVAPAPGEIEGGLKAQLVSAGRLALEQAKFTTPLKVEAPTGAAKKLYVALCPAMTVTELLPVSVQVTSVFTLRLTAWA
jgi:hypothetical protein